MLLHNSEMVSWFFCKNEFLSCGERRLFTSFTIGIHSYFLVKDRMILNVYSMLADMDFCRKKSFPLDKSYLLASSRRFIDDAYILCFSEPSEYFDDADVW